MLLLSVSLGFISKNTDRFRLLSLKYVKPVVICSVEFVVSWRETLHSCSTIRWKMLGADIM